jgi:hypothetical protein
VYGGFGSKIFTSSLVLVGANPFQGEPSSMKGPFSFHGEPLGGSPLQGHWNPTEGMLQWGKPLPIQFNPV